MEHSTRVGRLSPTILIEQKHHGKSKRMVHRFFHDTVDKKSRDRASASSRGGVGICWYLFLIDLTGTGRILFNNGWITRVGDLTGAGSVRDKLAGNKNVCVARSACVYRSALGL